MGYIADTDVDVNITWFELIWFIITEWLLIIMIYYYRLRYEGNELQLFVIEQQAVEHDESNGKRWIQKDADQ